MWACIVGMIREVRAEHGHDAVDRVPREPGGLAHEFDRLFPVRCLAVVVDARRVCHFIPLDPGLLRLLEDIGGVVKPFRPECVRS